MHNIYIYISRYFFAIVIHFTVKKFSVLMYIGCALVVCIQLSSWG